MTRVSARSKTQVTGENGRSSTIGRAAGFTSRLYARHFEGGRMHTASGRCTAASSAL